jgi:hypothetical protein
MTPSPITELLVYLRGRARLLLTQAPKEAPLSLLIVIALGIVLLLLYALAWKLDSGVLGP